MLHSETANPTTEFEAAASSWLQFLKADEGRLWLNGVTSGEPEVTPDGMVHEAATPEGLYGDPAIVDAERGTLYPAHYHRGEHELHIPLEGSAVYSIGHQAIPMQPGDSVVVRPETPHFILTDPISERYRVLVVGLPTFEEENQIPVGPDSLNKHYDREFFLGLASLEGTVVAPS